MANTRDAIDTITGYYYQFDYYILQLLRCKNKIDQVTIEGIEDVDVETDTGLTAVQCKYCSKTEYNHSVIAKPIRWMVRDFASRKLTGNYISYKLYGFYESGHDKFPGNITVEFAKTNLFTYTEKKTKHVLHSELGISDQDIQVFIDHLTVDIHAKEYKTLESEVISGIKKHFRCTDATAEYYYNNALRFVKSIATKQSVVDRTLSKQDFLDAINQREILFDDWYLTIRGESEYAKAIKGKYFTCTAISPYERFFLIDCDDDISLSEIKKLIQNISKKWSRLSKREATPFCPYVCLNGLSEDHLIQLKTLLHDEGTGINDGHPYLGSPFYVDDILKKANHHNGINIKIINSIAEVPACVEAAKGTVEVFNFYLDTVSYENDNKNVYCIKIPNTKLINKMI